MFLTDFIKLLQDKLTYYEGFDREYRKAFGPPTIGVDVFGHNLDGHRVYSGVNGDILLSEDYTNPYELVITAFAEDYLKKEKV